MYTLSELSDITGIDSTKLRLWKSRYGFPKSLDISEHRKYPDSELIKLLNVSILVSQGWRISKALSLGDLELRKVAMELSSPDMAKLRFAAIINGLSRAVIEYNQPAFVNLYRSAAKRISRRDLYREIDYPLLNRLQVLWRNARTSPLHQGFAEELMIQMYSAELLQLNTENYSELPQIAVYCCRPYDRLIMYSIAVYLRTKATVPVVLGDRVNYYLVRGTIQELPVVAFNDPDAPVHNRRLLNVPTTILENQDLPRLLDAFISSL